MRRNEGIFDAHVHTHGGYGVDGYLRNAKDHLSASGLDGENLLCVRHGAEVCTSDALALLAKYMIPGRFTVYCNPGFKTQCFDCSAQGLKEQVQDFMDAGMDGIKMAAGEAGDEIPLDSEIYTPAFELMEKNGFPLLYHVGGAVMIPPKRAFKKVHFPPFLVYRPGIDDDREAVPGMDLWELTAQREQIERVLRRHSLLRVTFAHMYFMSDELDGLADLLNRHPNVTVDLTPCHEIYYNLSRDPKRSREFLCDYSDRIIFGTDNTTEMDPAGTISMIRTFMETDESTFLPAWGIDVSGVSPLPKEVLDRIYRKNFFRSCTPQTVYPKKAAAFCEKLYDTLRSYPEVSQDKLDEVLEASGRFS